ncbi:putative cyclase-domain-containing protein [Irpex lacteus]|nr:putative cyclase-domain-containing protein [Irpex lacteus]
MSSRKLPTFDELPSFHQYTGCAWEVWGKDDELGTVNLLTDEVVAEASKEIKTGKIFGLNLPINFPGKPVFGRQPPVHNQWMLNSACNDDSLTINTQSGTQWDGMRHFGIFGGHNVFYNNTSSEELKRGQLFITDPDEIDKHKIKLGIHNWAQHGIVGRGVLLDLVRFYTDNGAKPLPYDPWTTHAIPTSDLEACAKAQGVTFRTGDILILRVGFTQRWYAATRAEREALHTREETFAGIEQSEDMKRFLWNNHFAAIASDQPAIERWPCPPDLYHMHSTLLGLWGMPIGEFFDLEKLSAACYEAKKYTFFFTSWPLNVLGGVASPPNAAAYL